MSAKTHLYIPGRNDPLPPGPRAPRPASPTQGRGAVAGVTPEQHNAAMAEVRRAFVSVDEALQHHMHVIGTLHARHEAVERLLCAGAVITREALQEQEKAVRAEWAAEAEAQAAALEAERAAGEASEEAPDPPPEDAQPPDPGSHEERATDDDADERR